MRTKFIEKTNEQYSIREDGEVIRHYTITNIGGRTQQGIDKIMTKYGTKNAWYVTVTKNGINKSIVINTLLFEYFGYKHCKKCAGKIYDKNIFICSSCMKASTLNYQRKNYHKYTSVKKKCDRKYVDNIGRGYAASLVGILVHELTDELYDEIKQQLLFKRKLAKEHNISIQSLTIRY